MILKKSLSIKDVVGNPGAIVDNEMKVGDTIQLVQAIGVVTSFSFKESKFGTSARFVGEFQFTNLKTGDKYFANVCYMPSLAEEMIVSTLKLNASEKTNHETGEVTTDYKTLQFAYLINLSKVERTISQLGYVYEVKPLIESPLNNIKDIEDKIKVIVHESN